MHTTDIMDAEISMELGIEEIPAEKHLEATIVIAATQAMGMSYATHLPWPKLKRENTWFEDITTRVTSESMVDGNNTITMNAVIMGYNTWDDEPTKLFPNRINVVISRTPGKVWRRLFQDKRKGRIHVAKSIADAVRGLQRTYPPHTNSSREGRINLGRIFIIGGAELCKTALEIPWVSRILLTRVIADFPCDTFFPIALDHGGNDEWKPRSEDDFRAWAGSGAPIGVQQENAIEWEVYMFERTASEDE